MFHETKYDDDSVRPRLDAEKVSEIADEIDSRETIEIFRCVQSR